MIRVVASLLLAGVLLSACGSISASTAMTKWVATSNYLKNSKALVTEAGHAVTALKDTTSSSNLLHTVCGVLDEESEQANSSLPTPDNQATNLLAKAYNTLGAGANYCYNAGSDVTTRARAIAALSSAVGYLAEATTRVVSSSTP